MKEENRTLEDLEADVDRLLSSTLDPPEARPVNPEVERVKEQLRRVKKC